ncbi:hypothetical protein Tco_0269905 [Tanacetum coccineum]
MNDFKRNKPEKIASNLKFLNNLQPEWSRHVTIVHQTKDLHTADYTQLYDFFKYNQKKVDDLRAERLAKTHDPLALMANSNNPFNYLIAQPGMNMGQERQLQMVGGNGVNQFRQYARQNVGNQNGYNAVQNVGIRCLAWKMLPDLYEERHASGHIFCPGPVWGCDRLVSRAKVIENQVMAISVISVSLDSSKDSVWTPAGRVILFSTIPTTIPDTTPVTTPPTTQTNTTVIPTETPIIAPTIPPSPDYTPASPDYSSASDSESDPSEDPSSDHIPPLPAISPFLSSANDTTDSDTPDTPPSPTNGTPFTEITSSTQRSPVIPCRRVMILAPGQPIPHG